MKYTCGGCLYWHQKQCHRFPPPYRAGALEGEWPVTTSYQWCGEWHTAGRNLRADPRNRANCAPHENSLSDGSGDGT
jgi:hypothetical protein